MKGYVINYSPETDEGIISGPDDFRYKFSKNDWKHDSPVLNHVHVDFIADGNTAKEIYCTENEKLEKSMKTSKSKKILDWYANKWSPIKEKILNSKFGIKYPRLSKLISNGWVVIFFVGLILSSNNNRDHASSNTATDSNVNTIDPRSNSPECRMATQIAKEICKSQVYDLNAHLSCLRDQINAQRQCPRL